MIVTVTLSTDLIRVLVEYDLSLYEGSLQFNLFLFQTEILTVSKKMPSSAIPANDPEQMPLAH